jgi:hypothetical protein
MTREWENEIARRVATYELGNAVLYSADEVFAEAKKMAP